MIKEATTDNIDNQEEVWDEISSSWADRREAEIPIVKEFLKEKSGQVLDFGCGSGRNMFSIDAIKFTGVDISSGQLKHARKFAKENNISAEFIHADLAKYSPNKESFDSGLFISTLHCIPSKKERLAALKNFYDALKQGAQALLTVWEKSQKRFSQFPDDVLINWETDKDNWRFYHLYSREELTKELETVGFKILDFLDDESDRFARRNVIVKVAK